MNWDDMIEHLETVIKAALLEVTFDYWDHDHTKIVDELENDLDEFIDIYVTMVKDYIIKDKPKIVSELKKKIDLYFNPKGSE